MNYPEYKNKPDFTLCFC